MRNNLEIKRNIFDLYDNARVLFNDFYNGYEGTYSDEDLELLKDLINRIEYDVKNIKEEL